MILEKKFEDMILKVSTRSALSASYLVEKDKIAADKVQLIQ